MAEQEFWSSPCSFLCCFLKKSPDDAERGSPEGLVDGEVRQYGTIKSDEEVSWNDLAPGAEQDNIDEGIVITDDISLNTEPDENIVLTNPDHTVKPIPASFTSDEDEASDAHTKTYAKDTIRDEIVEAGEKEPGHDNPTFVPSPVPEEEEEEEKDVKETLDVLEGALEGEEMGEEEHNIDIIDPVYIADEHNIDPTADEHILADEHRIADDIIATADTVELLEAGIPHTACTTPDAELAPPFTSTDAEIAPPFTPEPVLILPSVPLEPPSITITEEVTADTEVLTQSVPLPQELESASEMSDMGSSQSLNKKKKSKFKKFFKIRKKKKKSKLDDEQYKSTPSLSPGPSEHSQATIRSVYSMNSVLSNLDPDERNIASD